MASSNPEQEQERNQNQNRGWSGGLPSDVVAEIMSRFTSSSDRVRFGAVCSSWRRSAKQKQQKQHPPWLMLPGPQGVEDEHRSLYSVSERKFYRIHLPQIQGHHCLGSGSWDGGHGSGSSSWLVTLNNLTGQLQLLHLLLNAPIRSIPLPSITTLADVRDVGVLDENHYDTGGRLIIPGYMCRSTPQLEITSRRYWYFRKMEDMHYLFRKVVFFPSASLVFVLYNFPPRLAFARLGGDSWNDFAVDCTCIRDVATAQSIYLKGVEEDKEAYYCLNFCDVVFHKGQFYAISKPGWFLELHLAENAPLRCTCLALTPPPPIISSLKNKNELEFVPLASYLVEFPDGEELMQVRRYINWNDSYRWSYRTISFTVFKCKLSGGEDAASEWVEVKCLDEWVLFLGENLSLALSTNDFPELTPNSIYFTHTRMIKHMPPTELTDMGVFHLDSRIIEPVLDDGSSLLRYMTLPLPVWIPHIDFFPLLTQFNKYMVEELKRERKLDMIRVKEIEKLRKAAIKMRRRIESYVSVRKAAQKMKRRRIGSHIDTLFKPKVRRLIFSWRIIPM